MPLKPEDFKLRQFFTHPVQLCPEIDTYGHAWVSFKQGEKREVIIMESVKTGEFFYVYGFYGKKGDGEEEPVALEVSVDLKHQAMYFIRPNQRHKRALEETPTVEEITRVKNGRREFVL